MSANVCSQISIISLLLGALRFLDPAHDREMGGEAARLWRIGLGVRRSPCSRQSAPIRSCKRSGRRSSRLLGLVWPTFGGPPPTLMTLLADKSIAPVRVR